VTWHSRRFPVDREKVINSLIEKTGMDGRVRYDDRLNTVLKGAVPEGLAASMQWRQIVDLLAQRPEHLSGDSVSEGLKRLRDLRDRVPVEHRVESVEALGKRLQSAPLLVLLCGDEPRVASAAIDACSLSDSEIEELLPHLPERAKALMPVPETLRVVQDNSIDQPETLRDIAPNESQIPANEDGEGPSQIRQLVIRISDYQKQRSAELDEASVPTPLRALRVTNFDFATDPEGVINKVRGIPAGAIVGISISEPAMDEGPGPDAAGAAAFKQRRAVNNGRIRLLGSPQIEGTWRFSAAPRFDEVSGRFAGYEGTMRRPDIDEEAAPQAEPTFDQSQVQQFVHELRNECGPCVNARLAKYRGELRLDRSFTGIAHICNL